MREILFRGKIIELCEYQGQWLEGFYGVDDGKTFIAIQQKNGLNGFFCDPKTVGQYTGLTDLHGTRIFDGDIVDVNNALLRGRFWVEYEESGGTFIVKDKNDRRYFLGGCNCTVIGNIYDNPELMGG